MTHFVSVQQFSHLLLVVVALFILRGTALAQPAVKDWSTPASISYTGCFGPPGFCGPHPKYFRVDINWDPNISTTKIVPTSVVRFGPFHLKRFIINGSSHTPGPSVGFTISVWARSPALYTEGKFVGTDTNLNQIASNTTTITENESLEPIEKDVYVTATLPGVFSALQLRVRVTGGLGPLTLDKVFGKTWFPNSPKYCPDPPEECNRPRGPNDDCGFLPAASTLPPEGLDKFSLQSDQFCLRAAVNPLQVLVPRVLPLTIVYEPPGNCSYANLTHTHTAVTGIKVQGSQSTVTHTLKDLGELEKLFGDGKHEDFTEVKSDANSRMSQITVSQGETVGTIFGTPLEDPGGGEQCKNPVSGGPSREHRGPGQGDNFLLLIDWPIVYWNTANFSNFLFTPDGFRPPGAPRPQTCQIYAWELGTNGGIEKCNIHLTADEVRSILDLDPFTKPLPTRDEGGFVTPILPKRFFAIPKPVISLLPRHTDQYTMTRREIGDLNKQACTMSGNTSSETVGDPDLITKLTVTALAYDVGTAVGKAGDIFSALADKIKGVSQTDLFGQTEITTTSTYSICKNLETAEGNEQTQGILIMDTEDDVHTLPYYDTLFGTIAFVKLDRGRGVLNPSMGAPRIEQLTKLPSFVWQNKVTQHESLVQVLPEELTTKLKQLGMTHLESADAKDYEVGSKTVKGLLPGLQFNPQNRKLSGKITNTKEQMGLALFYVMNVQGKPIALLWVKSEVGP